MNSVAMNSGGLEPQQASTAATRRQTTGQIRLKGEISGLPETIARPLHQPRQLADIRLGEV
jgi:hypothetical protein